MVAHQLFALKIISARGAFLHLRDASKCAPALDDILCAMGDALMDISAPHPQFRPLAQANEMRKSAEFLGLKTGESAETLGLKKCGHARKK